MVKQTAGHDALGTFAPKFAELNDDVLFGEVWSREKQLSLRDRSIVTVTALMAQGLTDSSFKYHLETAKKNGVTGEEMAEILTHAAFMQGGQKHGLRLEWQRKFMLHECSYDENKTRRQDIEIYYSFVGKVDLPE